MQEVCGATLDELPAAKLFDPEVVSDALVRYGRDGRDLYGSGRPYWHFDSVTSLKPVLRRQVQAAWDLAFSWQAEEPGTNHTAVPPAVRTALLMPRYFGDGRERLAALP